MHLNCFQKINLLTRDLIVGKHCTMVCKTEPFPHAITRTILESKAEAITHKNKKYSHLQSHL